MKTFLIFTLSVFASLSAAVAGAEEIIVGKGNKVKILEYDPKTQTYEIEDVEEYGAGPFYVTPEQVSAAIPIIRLGNIKKAPLLIVGKVYTLADEIEFHTPDFLELRREELSP